MVGTTRKTRSKAVAASALNSADEATASDLEGTASDLEPTMLLSEDGSPRGDATLLVGGKPLGAQKGKNGPRQTKFDCAQCGKTRWLIDSEAGRAADLTRFSTCLFCDLRSGYTREVKKVRDELTREIASLEERLSTKIAGVQQGKVDAPLGPPSRADNSKLRDDVVQLKDLRFAVADLRTTMDNRLKELTTNTEKLLAELRFSAAGVTDSSAAGTSSSESQQREKTYSDVLKHPKQATDIKSNTRPSNSRGAAPKPQRGNAQRMKRNGKGAYNPGTQLSSVTTSDQVRPTNILLGDSLVGRATGRCFSNLRQENTFLSFPGAGISRIRDEVCKLDVARDSTLILAVGGNDAFPRRHRPCTPLKVQEEFQALIRAAKARVNRCIVVGLIPRRGQSHQRYVAAWAVNQALRSICSQLSVRFVDLWSKFWKMDSLYHQDGIHFSPAGAKRYAELIDSRLFKLKVDKPKNPTVAGSVTDQPSPPQGERDATNPAPSSSSLAMREPTRKPTRSPSPRPRLGGDGNPLISASSRSPATQDLVVTPAATETRKRGRSHSSPPNQRASLVAGPRPHNKNGRDAETDNSAGGPSLGNFQASGSGASLVEGLRPHKNGIGVESDSSTGVPSSGNV